MKERQMVVLFGDSLLMDTIEASLGENQELGVMRIHTTVPNLEERLKSLDPDLIIFDWDVPHSQFVLSFLRSQPGVPLLGLDITCSKATSLLSQEYITLTVEDLTQVIRLQTTRETGNGEHHSAALVQQVEQLCSNVSHE